MPEGLWSLPRFALLSFAIGSLLACSDRAPRERELTPGLYAGSNVIFLSIDTLRPDHLGCYGHSRATSPAIDGIAAQGALFERAFTTRGHTWPSLTSLLTALYPSRTNIRGPGELFTEELPTLASMLRDAGYADAAFLTNYRTPGCDLFSVCDRSLKEADATAKARKWLEANDQEPFFLWLHLLEPHAPYAPPPAFDRFADSAYAGSVNGSFASVRGIFRDQRELAPADLAYLTGKYDAEVLASDHQVGKFLETLRELDLLEKSVLVFFSDHGEDLYEHYRYIEHGCSIYDSTLRIPLVFRVPDGKLAGRRIDSVVEIIDVLPTVLDFLGIPIPDGLHGRSLLGLFDASPGDAFTEALSEHYREQQNGLVLSIRTERWRYIYNPEGVTPYCLPVTQHYAIGTEELYDHESDPQEQRNVVAQHPEVARRLRERLLSAYPVPENPGTPRRSNDEEAMRALRALGYIE